MDFGEICYEEYDTRDKPLLHANTFVRIKKITVRHVLCGDKFKIYNSNNH